MRISVAMATYNGERFIREQLDSLARQTYLPHELVVTDDGSTDRTLEIIEGFAKTAPFAVRAYLNEFNLGCADNFLKAASLCEADWIAFCDQDDVWLDKKLDHMVGILSRAQRPLLFVHRATVVDENLLPGRCKIPPLNDAVLRPLQGNPWFTPSGFAMVFKACLVRDFPSKCRPPSFDWPAVPMFHDRWIYFLASVMGNVIHCRQALALYRRHDNSVTATAKSHPDQQGSMAAVLKTGADSYLAHAQLIGEYAEFLDHLVFSAPSHYRKPLKAGVRHYRNIATAFEKRAFIYRNTEFRSRFAIIYFLARSGAYRLINRHGHPLRPFLKDLAYLAASGLLDRVTGTPGGA